jgi:hypothetical protein
MEQKGIGAWRGFNPPVTPWLLALGTQETRRQIKGALGVVIVDRIGCVSAW